MSVASLLVVGALIGLALEIPDSGGRHTVVAGPAALRTIPVEVGPDAATTDVRLLDGTRLRVTVPRAVGLTLAETTFADLELHGSLYAEWGTDRPPRAWTIDVSVGSVERLVPGGEPLVVPSSSRASAAVLDRARRRLGLQFGSWALVASGESLTAADVDALLGGVGLAEAPDGFVEYRGPLRLWLADSPDVRLGDSEVAVSVLIGDHCPPTGVTQTAKGLDFHRSEGPFMEGDLTEVCDRSDRLRLGLRTSRPLTDEEIDRVEIEVLSTGKTLAAVQRGEHP